MTTLQLTADESGLALAAATAAAAVLPAAEPVSPAGAPGRQRPPVTGPFAGAVVADLDGRRRRAGSPCWSGRTSSARWPQSPLGGLDLAAALQPTLDAVAAALGGRAGAARGIELGAGRRATSAGRSPRSRWSAAGSPRALLVPDTTLRVAVRAVTDQASAATGAQAAGCGTVLGGQPRPTPSVAHGATGTAPRRGIELLHGVDMEVTVEIGRTRMTVRDLLELPPAPSSSSTAPPAARPTCWSTAG